MRNTGKASTVVAAALSVMLSSCGSGAATSDATSTPAAAKATTTSESGLAPALYTHDQSVTVNPSENLADGQAVTVSVSGFGVGGKLFLSECANPPEANSAGCGLQLAAQPFGITNNKGSGKFSFKVSTAAGVKPYSKARAQCSGQCVIVATLGAGYGFAYAPIHFAKG